jgi:ketosteroid isomerase-like protein
MTIATLYAIAVGVAQCASPSAPALPPDLSSLVDAERTFAKASVARGSRAAFMEFLAVDGVVFRPDPVNGRTWYRAQPNVPSILAWEPEFADVSSSNDLGYTTGPWALRPDSTSPPGAFGHYVTVWRRGADREWEVAAEARLPHARVDRPKTVAVCAAGKPADSVTQQEALAMVQQEERDFIEAAARGIEDAIDMFGAEDLRIYRDGDLPVTGKDKARSLLAKVPGSRRMQTVTTQTSRAGDMAYTYGRCDITYHEETSTSYYLRIWKRMPDGAWKIVVDLVSAQ